MWDQSKYLEVKRRCEEDLRMDWKEPEDYMNEYVLAIKADDFESAKAITEVLDNYGYKTADMHSKIKCLNV